MSSRKSVQHVLGVEKAVVGMVHVAALPGTPRNTCSVKKIAASAVDEARVLADGGVDAIMIENMHDVPYLNRAVGPEIVAGMTAVGCVIQQAVSLPLGVQVLAGANVEALAVAQSCGAVFIRAEGFVFAHVADEGLMPVADAGELLRYRKMIGADEIAIWADIKKKHSSHSITADVDLADTAKAAGFCGADAVIVTGSETGQPADVKDLEMVNAACSLPVIVGSGVTPSNIGDVWDSADAFVVGSCLKKGGNWMNPPDQRRVQELVDVVRNQRKG